ncbi:hypothetical protein EON65_04380 [archaeon]|nr:MAG: hypothetical protein EON65_04380 [archaeon]
MQRKSDAWMVKFMEICYDDAFQLFSLPTDAIAMDLPCGGFENFPILVQRNINNLYSVLELRKAICLELLYSMELIMDNIERYRFSANRTQHNDPDEAEYDSGRVLLFSKFLSEEYDMDVLMMFLHSRGKMEGSLGKKLRYINPTRIYDVKGKVTSLQQGSNEFQSSELDKYGSSSGNGIKTTNKKVVPCTLPVKWRFLTDVTLPEVPVVAFHASLLHHILFTIMDKLSDEVKDYLLSFIYKMAIKDNLSISPSTTGIVSVPSHVPLYTVLRVLCAEYSKVTTDVKAKMNDSYIVIQSLGTLNTLCDNNNAIANDFQEKILALETKLSQLNLTIMQLQKKLKRYNKIFTNKLHQDDSLLDDINVLKQDILVASNQKQEVVQELLQINKAFQKHKGQIDNLWKQISTYSQITPKQEKKSLKASKKRVDVGEESKTVTSQQQSAVWRGKVLSLMHKILEYNREQYLENKEREIAKKQRPITGILVPSSLTGKREDSSPSTETTEQIIEELAVSPANRLLLVETLSRLFTHNVVKQCMYKHVVQKKLEAQQHALLLTYNTEYYQKEQARLKRLEEKRKQQLWMQAKKVMVNIFASDLVQQGVVPMATKAAFKLLYNSYYYLDLPDKEYIPIYQLFQVWLYL